MNEELNTLMKEWDEILPSLPEAAPDINFDAWQAKYDRVCELLDEVSQEEYDSYDDTIGAMVDIWGMSRRVAWRVNNPGKLYYLCHFQKYLGLWDEFVADACKHKEFDAEYFHWICDRVISNHDTWISFEGGRRSEYETKMKSFHSVNEVFNKALAEQEAE